MTNSSKIAVYAGTFDPITNGHRDIIKRASRLFDTLIIAVAESSRGDFLFSTEERIRMVEDVVGEMEGALRVESFSGLLVDFVRAQNSSVIVRGLRAVSDYDYEAQMAVVNRGLAADIETVFFVTSDKFSYVSASIVRDVAKNGGDISSLVPRGVEEQLLKKFPGS